MAIKEREIENLRKREQSLERWKRSREIREHNTPPFLFENKIRRMMKEEGFVLLVLFVCTKAVCPCQVVAPSSIMNWKVKTVLSLCYHVGNYLEMQMYL